MSPARRIYTRTGDGGETALGSGARVAKDCARIEAYGTVDELNSQLGLAIAGGLEEGLAEMAVGLQRELFHLGADLCVPGSEPGGLRIRAEHVKALEQRMDRLSRELDPLRNFILPGGRMGAAHLHLARTVARRAERRVIALRRSEPVDDVVVRYLNRLSDLLFVMARAENSRRGTAESLWDGRPGGDAAHDR